MDEVGHLAPADSVDGGIEIHVVIGFQGINQRGDMGRAQVRHDIDVQCCTRNAMGRAGHRASHAVGNSQLVQRIDNRPHSLNNIGSHNSRSVK
ncbi:MAG: hypothetical protein MJE77_41350 [Proteobacteria bacterium]|nr:hypothetical protein [Pseudomonadota bacterium]